MMSIQGARKEKQEMWGGKEPGAREKYAANMRTRKRREGKGKKADLKKKKGPKYATYTHWNIYSAL